MLKIQGKFPKKIGIAVSGGVDSMVLLDFFKNNHEVVIIFFDHGTETSKDARSFVQSYADEHKLEIKIGNIQREKFPNESLEEYWRIQRYDFFKSFDFPIMTAHHLNDCVETWIWSSCHGLGKIISYKHDNVIRPLLMTNKKQILEWAERKNVKWIEDKSNNDTKFMRNHIRHEMMPHVLKINPGIEKVIKKMIIKQYEGAPT